MGRNRNSLRYSSDDESSDDINQTPRTPTRRRSQRTSSRVRDPSPRIPRLQSSPSYPLSRQLSTSAKSYSQWTNGRRSTRQNQFHLVLSNSHFRDASVELKNIAPLLLHKYPPMNRFSHVLDKIFQVFENQLEAEQLQLIEEHCREGRKNPFLRNRKRLRSPERNSIYRNQQSNNMNVRRRLRSSQDSDDDDFEISSVRTSRGKQIRSNLNEDTGFNHIKNAARTTTSNTPKTDRNLQKDDDSSDSDSSDDFNLPVLRPQLPQRERCLISDFTSLTPYISDSDDDTETEELRKAAARRPTRWKSDILDDNETAQFEKRHYIANGKPYFCMPSPFRRMRRDAIVICPPAERTSDGHIPPLQWPNDAKQLSVMNPLVVKASPLFNSHFMSPSMAFPVSVPHSLLSSVPVTKGFNQQSSANKKHTNFRGPPKNPTSRRTTPAKLQEIDQMLGLTNRPSQGVPSDRTKSNSFPSRPPVARSNQPPRQQQHRAPHNSQQSHNVTLNARNQQIATQASHTAGLATHHLYIKNNQTRVNQIPPRTLAHSTRETTAQPQNQRTSSGFQLISNKVINTNGLAQNRMQNRPANVPNGNIQLQGGVSGQMQRMNFQSGTNRTGYSSSHQHQYHPSTQNNVHHFFPQHTTGGSQMITGQRVQNQMESSRPHARIGQEIEKVSRPQQLSFSLRTNIPPQMPSGDVIGINHSESLAARVSDFQQLNTLTQMNSATRKRKNPALLSPTSPNVEVINLVDEQKDTPMNQLCSTSRLRPSNEHFDRNQLHLISNINPNRSMENIRVNFRQNMLESGAMTQRSRNVDAALINGVIMPNGNGLPIHNSLVNNTNTGAMVSQNQGRGNRRISDEELLMEFNKQYQAELALEMEKARKQPHR